MASYKPYTEGLQGFITGRKLAKEDRLEKQSEAGRQALGGMLQNELKTTYPGETPPDLTGLNATDQTSVFNFYKQKAAEKITANKAFQEEKKAKIDKTLDFWKTGMATLKELKGKAKIGYMKELNKAVAPTLKELNIDIPVDTIDRLLDEGGDTSLKSLMTDFFDYTTAFEKGVITKEQLKENLKKAVVAAIELETEERKTMIDRVDKYKKDMEPDKDADATKRKGFEELYPQQAGKVGTPEYASAFRDYTNKTNEKMTISVSGAEARGRAFANERFYSMYDTKAGKTVKVKGYELNRDGGNRFIDPSDPELSSDKQSLTKITKGMDAVAAFESGGTKALEYAESVAKDFGLGKYPQANKISQLFQYNLGDPKVKGLKNALTTASTEYMKVINAGSDLTAAELTVMGQQRAKEIIEASDNFESLKQSIKIMKREMQISGDKFKAQRTEVKKRLKGYGEEAPTGPTNTVAPAQSSKFKILKVE
jgi:hypothetical protein